VQSRSDDFAGYEPRSAIHSYVRSVAFMDC